MNKTIALAVLSAALWACDEHGNLKNDPETRKLIEDGRRTGQWLKDQAEKEQSATEKQMAELDAKVERVQKLIDAGKYDEAEVQLVDITWIEPRPNTTAAQELSKKYDQKRDALKAVIDRKRRG